jgi:CRISPR/Cas system-associated exonuclease Cas4 (RecB family)
LIDYDSQVKPIDELIKELYLYSEEMQEIADGYADFVVKTIEFEKKRSSVEPLVVIEQHLDMDFDEDAGGTLDCGIISSVDDGTLTVIDLKSGRTPVYALDSETGQINTQLGIYALYFYKAYKDLYPVKRIRLVIYQPVISNTNDYEMSIDALLHFEANTLVPAVERTRALEPEANPGKHCKYCPGNAICASRSELYKQSVQAVIETARTLTDAEIEVLLPHLDEVIQYAKDVLEFAIKKAVNGHQWKGFKLVHTKGSRKVTDEEGVIKACENAGIDPYAPKKVAGITELTKRIGKDKVNTLIGAFIDIQLGSQILVPNSDPREEAKIIKEGDINKC